MAAPPRAQRARGQRSRDRTVRVWSVRTGRLLGTFAGGHWGSVLCLKFELALSSNLGGMRGTLVTGSSDCTVCLWDLWTESAEVHAEVRAEVRAVLREHGRGVLNLRIDQRWIVSCSKDVVVRVWGRESLELERVLRGHEGPVNAVGLESGEYDEADAGDEGEGDAGYGEGSKSQRHEERVVSASGGGKSGERVRTFEGHDRGLACIEFKGDLIISGSNDMGARSHRHLPRRLLAFSWTTGFPFNVLRDPMYVGSTMSFAATALWYERPAGLFIMFYVYIVYLVALRFEGPLLNTPCLDMPSISEAYTLARRHSRPPQQCQRIGAH
ncbi:WD40-repeat-containing domain protein [Mycena albidolilacea]|uniref:WD40-repeat-containing domain protein n=1 Tax=Mycena albidolilacea TaxID=1033008 RepID=A0AAD6ZY42_9AGAR|nr:WD40-repeat-containing domain protein [Mycena albidolilacea]